jgi:16S rRNA (cytosine967-C5)-methyltransferase
MSREERVRDVVLALWTKTRIDWGFATDRIAEAFRRDKSIGAAERRVISETLYGMIRQARRIDFALDAASPKLLQRERDLARWLAYRLLSGEIDVEAAKRALPSGVDWAAVVAVDGRISREKDPIKRLGLARSLPDWLAKRLLTEWSDQADALAEGLNARAPLTIRANTIKITRDALIARLKEEGVEARPARIARAGIVLETRVNIYGLPSFKEGLFEAQDEASQLVAELVLPGPRSLVIDACAGAGGKTLALGALMGGTGRLVALDPSAKKLDELRRRARRAGLSNARALEIPDGDYPDEVMAFLGKADRVLVDAPCSGIGALRRNPEARWRLGEEDLRRLPREQLTIARRAGSLVAPGGRLIYATCTVLRDENEAVIEKFLHAEPSFERVLVKDVIGAERSFGLTSDDGFYLKLTPHRHDTDGFFAAVLRKKQ